MRKILILLMTNLLLLGNALKAQTINWQNLDLAKDSIFGISIEKTYELLKGLKSKRVIVAVIDGGIDTIHEDLKNVLWNNTKEKINNKDDDNNAYKDDVHGWNFIGSGKGNVQYDNLELTRIIRQQRDFYDSLADSVVPERYRKGYYDYLKKVQDYYSQLEDSENNLATIGYFRNTLNILIKEINKKKFTLEDFIKLKTYNEECENVRNKVIEYLKKNPDFDQLIVDINEEYAQLKQQVEYHLNMNYDSRFIVDDKLSQFYYGNNNVCGPDPKHGTHVAGIIGAERNNDIGVQGIADNVAIMGIRVVPNGDERDKDVANGIRYAVVNGAKVINLSFGKSYSQNKSLVDDAVKYAMSKDVLIVHAAGNDYKNLDIEDNFPNRYYADSSGEAEAWIEVGASGWKNDANLPASFSNYGRTAVDVFAPGIHIYSTTPKSHYNFQDGTSMAAPIVTGIAALIREYYPKLTALQVKDIIMRSVVKVNHDVIILEHIGRGNKSKKIPFCQLCLSGGIVNAYNALLLAKDYCK